MNQNHRDAELALGHGSEDGEEEVEDGVVVRRDELALPVIVLGDAVARAGDEVEELREAVQEVEDLGDEEEEERLAEMAQYGYHSKTHSRKIGERVPHKHARRKPVVIPQR